MRKHLDVRMQDERDEINSPKGMIQSVMRVLISETISLHARALIITGKQGKTLNLKTDLIESRF